jgi:hypothetical protein
MTGILQSSFDFEQEVELIRLRSTVGAGGESPGTPALLNGYDDAMNTGHEYVM